MGRTKRAVRDRGVHRATSRARGIALIRVHGTISNGFLRAIERCILAGTVARKTVYGLAALIPVSNPRAKHSISVTPPLAAGPASRSVSDGDSVASTINVLGTPPCKQDG